MGDTIVAHECAPRLHWGKFQKPHRVVVCFESKERLQSCGISLRMQMFRGEYIIGLEHQEGGAFSLLSPVSRRDDHVFLSPAGALRLREMLMHVSPLIMRRKEVERDARPSERYRFELGELETLSIRMRYLVVVAPRMDKPRGTQHMWLLRQSREEYGSPWQPDYERPFVIPTSEVDDVIRGIAMARIWFDTRRKACQDFAARRLRGETHRQSGPEGQDPPHREQSPR